jgi:hypothetical protein
VLYLRESVPAEAREVQQLILGRLRALNADGTLDELRVETWDHRARRDDRGVDTALTAYHVFDSWASARGVSMAPAFDEHRCRNAFTDSEYTTTTLPVLCLAVYEEGKLLAVYPHRGPEGAKTVLDGLELIEAETRSDERPVGPAGYSTL